jgi:hypothetical protein
VPHAGCGAAPVQAGEPARPRVADIFRAHGEAYRRSHALGPEQLRALHDIATCRTAERGGHLAVCDHCGHQIPVYNSCLNRHCPQCQSFAQAEWVAQRKARVLPCPYFHVIFTLPAELRPLVQLNRALLFDLLFDAAAGTLLLLGRKPKHLGGQLGLTAVLHTWNRKLEFHPHLHCIVTGGALSADASRWLPARARYLFPERLVADLFRGRFLAGLRRLHDAHRLRLPDDIATPAAFSAFLDGLAALRWRPHVEPPLPCGPGHLLDYLGRYLYRTGISDQRLLRADDAAVTFATKDGETITLTPETFIHRFLQHVLPHRFVKVRHYGLLASANATTRLEQARRLLQPDGPPAPPPQPPPDPHDRIRELTGKDLTLCPRCKIGHLVLYPLPRLHAPCPPPVARDTS